MSVLPKSRQLVFSIRNYIRDTSELFSISSLVKISLMSFLCFSFVLRLVFFLFSKHLYLCNKKKFICRFEHINFIFSWKIDFTHSLRSLMKYFFHSKINFICSRHRVIISIYYVLWQTIRVIKPWRKIVSVKWYDITSRHFYPIKWPDVILFPTLFGLETLQFLIHFSSNLYCFFKHFSF